MYGQTLEELNLDMEGYTPRQELYDEEYQPDYDAGIGEIDLIPPILETLRIYGRGQPMHPGAPYLDYNSDLDVDAQIEQLACEKVAKLPGLNVLEGVDPRIPNGWHVYPRQQDYNPELHWQGPETTDGMILMTTDHLFHCESILSPV
ncbi:hypothetical protein N7499_007898 [Penicillium canescens]|uniref:Uncharacterized protein n=1 Tax=Penicillium canescens TaxID=5083 RepID=A0AAD6N1Q8_PENCN|nr:uncharacterized protein N7446_012933 [Penicillium canescens]KAJ6022583.1 hypothetical protein N7460_012978 [Penicillium canescens]KAJ6041867.1 hypothetical protein N7446_012933 [Penicillium canescens]KAJ6075917.1 hypothetical protein N7499_007898 [Penicillium canescens]KAJ6158228.1 hypothetical protein N7485_011054 [Penicillium canescens]